MMGQLGRVGKTAASARALVTMGSIRMANRGQGSRVSSERRNRVDNTEDEEEAITPPLKHEFFVTCHPGLEETVASELRWLQIERVEPGQAGVSFQSDKLVDGYRACFWLRSAIRVLLLLSREELGTDPITFRSGQSIYEAVRRAATWHEVIQPGQTFAIESRVWSCTDLTNSQLASTRVKDAICDHLRDAKRPKPPPPEHGGTADVPLYVSFFHDTMKVYRDLSGMSLHRRGYRDKMHKSPLNEAAAAGILLLSGWRDIARGASGDGEDVVLVDPMCGSGTLLSEAALIATNRAPGLMRPANSWPFRKWADRDNAAIMEAVEEARSLYEPGWKGKLIGCDVTSVSLAQKDAEAAMIGSFTTYSQEDCTTFSLEGIKPSLVVSNPPWGERMGADPDELEKSWRALSDFLRRECGGSEASILSGNKDAFNYLRMKPSLKHKLSIGGIETRLHKYKILPPKTRD